MNKKPPYSVVPGAGFDAQTRSIGGGVEQRLLRIVARRRSTRLHVVPKIPLTLASKRVLADAHAATKPGAKRTPADASAAAVPAAPRIHVVVCGRGAGTFVRKPAPTK